MSTRKRGKEIEKAIREGGGPLSQMLEEEREKKRKEKKETIRKFRAGIKIIQESPENVKASIRTILEDINQSLLTSENIDEIIKALE